MQILMVVVLEEVAALLSLGNRDTSPERAVELHVQFHKRCSRLSMTKHLVHRDVVDDDGY